MGKVREASQSFRLILTEYPEHEIATRARLDLLEYARLHQDRKEELRLLHEFAFEVERTDANREACVKAARELASMHFFAQDFERGRQALATSYQGDELDRQVREMTVSTIRHLWRDGTTQADARRLADGIIASLRKSADLTPGVLYRIADLHAMVDRRDRVWALYDEIAKAHGTDDGLRRRRAEWLLNHDRRDEAKRWYERFEDEVAGTRALVGLAEQDGDWERVHELYRRLLEIDGEQAEEYQWAIAGVYERQGEWKMAIATYRMVDRFPSNHFKMAACHRKLGEWKEAILLYQQTKVIDAAAPKASIEIGFTHEQAGEKEQAIRTFQLTCKRYPKSAEAARAHAHLQDRYQIHVTLGGAEEK
jgi:tetratricopeptide (TPR) repeat protein